MRKVVQLPSLSHRAFGGNPLRTCRSTKSESLVTMMHPSRRAASQISSSLAAESPSSATCVSPGRARSAALEDARRGFDPEEGSCPELELLAFTVRGESQTGPDILLDELGEVGQQFGHAHA